MRACGFQLLAHGDVVFEVILGAVRIEDIAGVADRAFADLAGFNHRIHGHTHVLYPVEAVEHAEHVHSRGCSGFHEMLHNVVGIICVAHAIGGAQQHLRHDVGHLFTDVAQALPRAFLQEPVGHIEGRTAPTLYREKRRQIGGVGGRDLDHVMAAHACGQKALVSVAHGRIGDQQLALLSHPVSDGLWALLFQQVARAHHRLCAQLWRLGRALGGGGKGLVLCLGVAVHADICDVGQHLRPPVKTGLEGEQLGCLVNEFGVIGIVEERGVLQQVFHESDVGTHTPDAEFAQGAVHPRDGLLRRLRLGGDLDQKAVVIARDHAARVGGAAVQTDAHACGLAEGSDAAIIGDEVVQRVFGGNPRLQCVAGQLHIVLRGLASGLGNGLAFGNQDLCAHDVDAGDLLGHGVFNLHAGVHLDEVKFLRLHIHQEFDGACTFIVHMGADFAAQLTDMGALFLCQVGGRRAFDHLLVAALDGAVALEEVIDLAVAVTEDLYLHVTGFHDHLFQITLAVAKGGLGLATALAHLLLQLALFVDRTHAASAAAP